MYGTSSPTSAGVTSDSASMPQAFADDMRRAQLLHALLGPCDLDAARLGEDVHLLVLADALDVSAVISFEWSTGKMKFDACPVEPPGLGSGPLSTRTTSVQPCSARW